MRASEKLKALEARTGDGLIPYELEAALPQIVAVVEAAERIYEERERVPTNHKTGVRPDSPRYIHEWRTRALLERPLAALDDALTAGGKEEL